MVQEKNASVIINHNEQQSVKEVIQAPGGICVFGGTIRYSEFERYIATVKADFAGLSAQYAKNKRLKGVTASVKEFITSVDATIGIERCAAFLKTASQQELIRLFFDCGINQQVLKNNFGELLNKNALEQANVSYFIHMLVPCYFTDLAHLKDDPNIGAILAAFLKEVTLYIKSFYDEVGAGSGVKICIVIPRLDYFMRAVTEGKNLDKLKINVEVVQKELIELIGSNNNFLLIDQSGDELAVMVNALRHQGIPKVSGKELLLTNSAGFPTTKFNPYVLKNDTKHAYHISVVLNQQLLHYLQKKFGGEKTCIKLFELF